MSQTNRLRLMLVMPDHIGDLVVRTPALVGLRELKPGAEVTLFSNGSAASLIQDLGLVDRFVSCSAYPEDGYEVRHAAEFTEAFDAALVFPELGARRWLRVAKAWGVPRRIGIPARWRLFDPVITQRIPLRPPFHESERAMRMVEGLLGARIANPRYQVSLDLEGARAMLIAHGIAEPPVVVHWGSVTVQPYPWDWAIRVAQEARGQIGSPVVITGSGTPPKETPEGIHCFLGKTSLPELAGVIACSKGVVSGSTSAAHLAAALGSKLALVETKVKGLQETVHFLPGNIPIHHFPFEGALPDPRTVAQALASLIHQGPGRCDLRALLNKNSRKVASMDLGQG